MTTHLKYVLHLMLIFVLGSCSSLKYLDAFDGHKNKPSKVEVTTYKVSNSKGEIEEKMAFKIVHYYDAEGRKVTSTDFKSDGTPSSGGRVYFYDKYGNLTQMIVYMRSGSVYLETNYRYNKHGQKVEWERIRKGKKTVYKSTFDRKNRLVKRDCKDLEGRTEDRIILRFDEEWREIELTTFDNNCDQKRRIESFYNDKGKLVLSKWYNSKDELYEFYENIYSPDNCCDKLSKSYLVKNGEPILKAITEENYIYDEHGNWIEKRLILDGENTWVTKRKFEYYHP